MEVCTEKSHRLKTQDRSSSITFDSLFSKRFSQLLQKNEAVILPGLRKIRWTFLHLF